MTGPLDAPWNWYVGVRDSAQALQRVRRHWDELVELGLTGSNSRELTGEQVEECVTAALRDVQDIAVLYLFSVFEALIRDDTVAKIQAERPSADPVHPLYSDAMRRLDRLVAEGNVSELINAYAAGADDPLKRMLAAVHGVREYRNWVAHGRRGSPKNGVRVTPDDAKERLEDFLHTVRAFRPT